MDRLCLKGLRIECIVGVYPSERHTPQPLELDLTASFDSQPAAYRARLEDTVDYTRLWSELRFILQTSRFSLLESAAEAIARYVLAPPTTDAPRAALKAAKVRLTKPQALGGAGRASLEIHRRSVDYHYDVGSHPFGHSELVFAAGSCSISRVHIASGHTYIAPACGRGDAAELILGSTLLLDGKPQGAGSICSSVERPRRYCNTESEEQCLLAITSAKVPLPKLTPASITTTAVHPPSASAQGPR